MEREIAVAALEPQAQPPTSVKDGSIGAGSQRVPSPYQRVGRRFIERGISAIPIVPGEKRPGEFRLGEWRGMPEWQRFCNRLPTALELDHWERWPRAGIGVALGEASRLQAADLDHGSPEVRAAIESLLPPSPVRKIGAKGYSGFYRHNPKLGSRKWLVEGQPVLELLGHGRQTVLPPTIHPDGMPYSWITRDTLEDFDVADLPILPDDFCERIDTALQPFQSAEDRGASSVREKWSRGDELVSYWRELNDRALANLGAWVPALFPQAMRTGRSYRVIANWRGCENANVGIHPDGIRDFGGNQGLTPLDLVMAAMGCDLEEACKWLKPRVGMPEFAVPILPPFYPNTDVLPAEAAAERLRAAVTGVFQSRR
jgi:hypothetical protein